MSKGKILVIGSNGTDIQVVGGSRPIGQYLNETVVPIWAIRDAGYDFVLATPKGTPPHLDESALTAEHFGGDEAVFRAAEKFFVEDPSMTDVKTLTSVLEAGLDDYAGVFVPGGHAPVVDLMDDPETGEILRHFQANRKPTALICHGPIALISTIPAAHEFRVALVAGNPDKASELAKGWSYAGYKMTIYSNSESKPVEENLFHAKMLFHVVDALEAAGGVVVTGPDFQAHVIEDRELITGQNPQSDHAVGAALARALNRATVPA
jgi:putative intracellular protease/amidase